MCHPRLTLNFSMCKKKNRQTVDKQLSSGSSCDPYRIQTCNLLIRSQTLYSIELRDHFFVLAVQSYCYFLNWQAFWATFFKKNYRHTTTAGIIYHNASRLDEVTKNQFSSQVASAQMTKITSAMKVAANRGLYLTT